MVFALVILTVLIFIAVDYFLRKEDRQISATAKSATSPIFIKPEQSLLPLEHRDRRRYHQSHTWAMRDPDGYSYVGFDDFVSWLFPETVHLDQLPNKGSRLNQGDKIWEVGNKQRHVTMRAPLSGTVLEVNPALRLGIPLNSADIEKSWILKMLPGPNSNENANLLPSWQAEQFNGYLKDDLVFTTQKDFLLNDGGAPDNDFFDQLSADEWLELVARYFPGEETVYHK